MALLQKRAAGSGKKKTHSSLWRVLLLLVAVIGITFLLYFMNISQKFIPQAGLGALSESLFHGTLRDCHGSTN
jgi:hypothetical protein